MKTEWENTDLFKRHIEEMTAFRHAHVALKEPEKQGYGISAPQTPGRPASNVSDNLLTDEQGRVIVVPIWNVSASRDSQN